MNEHENLSLGQLPETSQDALTLALGEFSQRLLKPSKSPLPRPSDWIQQHFYVPEPRDPVTGRFYDPGPIRLSELQIRLVDEALKTTIHPEWQVPIFKYTNVLFSTIKKSGKSTLASAAGLYVIFHTPFSRGFCLANDGEQSNDILFGPIYMCIALHEQLGGIFKGIRANLDGVILKNGSRMEPLPCDAVGNAGKEPTVSLWCFDEETEILTRSGWKSYQTLDETDHIATLNQQNGLFEWQLPDGIHRSFYTGEMYQYESKQMSVMVTPNHHLYARCTNSRSSKRIRKTQFQKLPIEDALKSAFIGLRLSSEGWKGNIPETETFLPAAPVKYKAYPALSVPTDRLLELLGWYVAEGSINYKITGKGRRADNVVIGQSLAANPAKWQHILDLVESLGFKPHPLKSGLAIQICDIRLTRYLESFGFGNAHEKYIPTWIKNLDTDSLRLFFEAYMAGDGYLKHKKSNLRAACTNSPRLRDDLLEVGQKLGYSVSWSEYQDKRWGKLCYHVHFRDGQNGIRSFVTKRAKWEKVCYQGNVFCPSTKNGVVLVRRRGKVYWQGQSELHGFETEVKRKLWAEMTVPPTKYGRAIRWVETYAGYQGVSKLLWELYQLGYTGGQAHPDFLDITSGGEQVVKVNEDAGLFWYWDHEPRMYWQRGEEGRKYYTQEAKQLPPAEFRRLHKNEWVSPVGSFIQPTQWDDCDDPTLPEDMDSRTPVVVALDAAETNDCAAMVAVYRHPIRSSTDVAVLAAKIFKPGGPTGTILLEDTIGRTLLDWGMRWNIVVVGYDNYQLAKLVQDYRRGNLTLSEQDLVSLMSQYAGTAVTLDEALAKYRRAIQRWYYKYSQQSQRAVADKQLYDLIVHRRISYNSKALNWDIGARGDVETLTKHVKQAGASQGKGQYRLVKLSNEMKIDGAVALSMASELCLRLNLGGSDMTVMSLTTRLEEGDISLATFEEFMAKLRSEGGIE